jgi:uncharacterized Zn finger protein (UPF0148 family)
MSTCPQCGMTVQAGVVLCPYCKVNMHILRRSELNRSEPRNQSQQNRVHRQGPTRERNARFTGERRPGPDGLSIGKLTGVLFTSGRY